MRKSEKRRLGAERQAENLAKSKESGLKALAEEQERRERQFQAALVQRDSNKKFSKEDKPQSNISKEKQARVAARLAAKSDDVVLMDAVSKHPNLKGVSMDLFAADLGESLIDSEYGKVIS